MSPNGSFVRALVICSMFVAAIVGANSVARAQLVFTEVMHNPRGDDSLWEWVEVRNTGASAINLHGYVFDDDDDVTINEDNGPNIVSDNGNTIIPAGGIAVLYPGDGLDFTPSRFTDAWGSGVNLIAVDGFTSLTATDAIGLWPNYDAYVAAAIPGATTSPRRTFAGTSATLNYTVGFPAAGAGKSLAWKGTGGATDPAQWVVSAAGDEGALGPFREKTSVATIIPSAPVNDVADFGSPGVRPSGAASSGLLITEILFAPASPAATAGWTSTDFEWVEIFNNTGAAINFENQHYVFDDFEGEMDEANVQSGALANGQLGVLFNGDMLTTDDMVEIWGPGNYIPVDPWPSLNNTGGDTIAIWDDHDTYLEETVDEETDHREHANAVASVTYNTVAGMGWPTISNGKSIYLTSLTANPNTAASWKRSGTTGDTLSFNALPLLQELIDHPGNDVGSPGTVGVASATELYGDYNNDGKVDALDYTRWRNNFGGPASSLFHRDPANNGNVGEGDFNSWKLHYGETASGGGGIAASLRVPEPAGIAVLTVATALALRLRRRV